MIGFHGKNTKNGKITGNMKPMPSEHSFNPLLTRLLSFILSISILLTVAAPFAEPQTVEANWVTKTIGALITSLALQSGAANIDTNYLNYVNDPNNTVMQIEIPNDGGVTSLPSDLASQIDTAIQTAPPAVQRTVQQFQTTNVDVEIMNHALNEAGADPSSLNLTPASAGQNIAASAQELQNTGSVNPSFGGQAFGALQGIISGGAQTILGQKIRESVSLSKRIDDIEYVKGLYDNGQINETEYANWMSGKVDTATLKTIANGVSINTNGDILNLMQAEGNIAVRSDGPRWTYRYIGNRDCIFYCVYDSNSNIYNLKVLNIGNAATTVLKYQNKIQQASYSVLSKSAIILNSGSNIDIGTFQLVSDEQAFINSYLNGEKENEVYSPSLIGSNGQLTANYNIDPTLNLNYYTTNEAPIYNYNNYNMEPVDLNEYTQFAQSIQQQIASETPQAEISEAIEQYVNQHLVAAPIPTAPPVVPDQPTPVPKPTGTPEQQQENQELMATPELKDKFPFCIPWDIYYAFAVLEDQREAPAFDFDLDLGPAGTHHIEIDFADWEDIASLLRLLELLAFIIGLAIATKRLMGGTGA